MKMDWRLALEIVGFIGGIATFIGLMLAPMFYLGTKIDNIHKDLININVRLSILEERSKQ
jgi:hypothetical protein